MWLDESLALQAVEKRLGNSVPELQADFSLPKEIAELGTVYGEEAHAVGGRENLHLEMLGPTVLQLGTMEVQAQSLFHELQTQFGRFESNDEAYAKKAKAARVK